MLWSWNYQTITIRVKIRPIVGITTYPLLDRRIPMYYENILYNEVIYELEQAWNRELTAHEKNVLIFGYQFGRKVEATCELKILSHK
jgi:hypothetical protein